MLSVVITRFIRRCFDDCLKLVVIPAPEPGSIGGGGVFPLPKMDPGSGAGMTAEFRSMSMRIPVAPCTRPAMPCPTRSAMAQFLALV